jgi:hypothetical protein
MGNITRPYDWIQRVRSIFAMEIPVASLLSSFSNCGTLCRKI